MPPPSYKKTRRMIKASIAISARWDIEAEEDGEIEDENENNENPERSELLGVESELPEMDSEGSYVPSNPSTQTQTDNGEFIYLC